jgi:ribonuclease P protein component
MHPQPLSDFKIKRLKGKTTIDYLFKKGAVFQTKNLLLLIGVSVSKRNFNRAVDRNRIKRQLRSVVKQLEHDQKFGFRGECMILYTGKRTPKTKALLEEASQLLNKTPN